MNEIVNVSRRQLIKGGAASLTLAFFLPLKGRLALAEKVTAQTRLNAFLTLETNGQVTFYSPFIEMGQGTYTSLPMLVAEEMDIDIARIKVVQAPHGKQYKIMFGGTQRFTGGSYSIRSSYDILRHAGAAARLMLINAAAKLWNVPVNEISTESGDVLHRKTNRKIAYGQLVQLASKENPPENPTLKSPSAFRYIGKAIKRTDTTAKTDGSAIFGIDINIPGMLYAAVKKTPIYGAKVLSFDAAAVRNMPGVVTVETIPQGVAVIADRFWRAQKALEKLPIQYQDTPNQQFSSAQLAQQMRARLDETGVVAESKGDVLQAFEQAEKIFSADYEVPFLAHTTMEPMNCTAHVTNTFCELWAPNQGVDFVAEMAAKITGLPLDKIIVHTPYLGGGYGRRFYTDVAEQAVVLSKKLGKPIKVVWSREEDVRQDFFRPMTVVKHRAAIDQKGTISAWHSTLVGEGPIGRLFGVQPDEADNSVVEGARHQPYQIANKQVDWVQHKHPIPIGFWRSVGHSFNGFITESFVDEMAFACGKEPVAFRQELLTNSPRFLAVLNQVTEMADYQAGVSETAGIRAAYGVAIHESFNSIVAQVAQVSIVKGQAKVHKIWCAVDCGLAVNPDTIEAQMQSGISTGLSQLFLEEVTFEQGKTVQNNFHNYPILPPHMMPAVEVKIIQSGAEIGGIGEPGTPPTAAAVTNAIFKLTKQRIRRLPIANIDLSVTAEDSTTTVRTG
ncbi:MAG: molybdopterin-dependent oxidoreductase [Pseudomonadales bacterium]|nr:molybdopterin-dependent oxidoreductase [Pseudomonadales bacterium]